jgi:hypothetical protein
MGDRVTLRAAVATVVVVVAVIATVAVIGRTQSGHVGPDTRAARSAAFYTARRSRLTPSDWVKVKNAVRLRRLALAPGRSAFYRSFAAGLGLSGLTTLHPIRRGRCAIAISYLYDNLLDLAHAYPGENWQPLRRLIRKQPSLRVCAPKPVPRRTYVA